MKPLPPSELGQRATLSEHPGSVVKILEGTLNAVGSVGARRLSMSDICEASGVSRGTLYRYFSSKEEVLAAASEFVCVNFENGIREVGSQAADPIERFRIVMRFFADFTMTHSPHRIFEVEPAFHLDFFRSHFARHKSAVRDALDPVFDHIEGRLAARIDRDAFVEVLVRIQLSSMIVPATQQWREIWNAAPDAIEAWLVANTAPYESKEG